MNQRAASSEQRTGVAITPVPCPLPAARYDLGRIRRDFPILKRSVRGKPLVYLDNAATTQKPQAVIDRIVRFYTEENSNVHRGVHYLSEVATAAYEGARTTVKPWGGRNVGAGDCVLITAIEHHSNIVPWQILCDAKGAKLLVAPVSDEGELIQEEYLALLERHPKIVAFGHASNALGTINPVKAMTKAAHDAGALVLIDGAQGVPHSIVDVQEIGCDFYAFSGHKVYGPTGIGALYGKEALLEAMPPYQGGGDMILSVSFEKTTYNALPYKFEAGTPNIEGVVGLAAALDYVGAVGIENITTHEQESSPSHSRASTHTTSARSSIRKGSPSALDITAPNR